MIHPSALIDRRATIDPTAELGPFVVIDGPAVIGARTRILAHATLIGHTTIGADNTIHCGAVIGGEPQDLGFAGAESYVRIGDRNVLREGVTVHRGTKPGSATEIGNDNYLMNNAHVAHNCRIGDRTIIASGAVLGGYVQLDDRVFVSGNCAVHQFVRVGRLALLRGLSRTSRDVPPFCIMDGTHTVRGLNLIGLRRAGFSAAQINALRGAFRRLFRAKVNLRRAVAELAAESHPPEVIELLDFIRSSQRGVCFGPRARRGEEE
ncbi:MAG: acyl-ACP--UDP-N-acetylglucosamine O-acyltransferase [Deltaproteobacteria bacterium]|nr:acyl-ACP--UDP-N-acetylglucosamine O-acyltransferase [Deltaproteobacteria bacterium]